MSLTIVPDPNFNIVFGLISTLPLTRWNCLPSYTNVPFALCKSFRITLPPSKLNWACLRETSCSGTTTTFSGFLPIEITGKTSNSIATLDLISDWAGVLTKTMYRRWLVNDRFGVSSSSTLVDDLGSGAVITFGGSKSSYWLSSLIGGVSSSSSTVIDGVGRGVVTAVGDS